MSAATVRLALDKALTLEAIHGSTEHTRPGILICLGPHAHDVQSCAILPLEKLGALRAALDLMETVLATAPA